MKHPLAVAPPETTSCIVMVLWLVREAVVVPVKTHPLNWAALAGQGAHDHEDTLEPYGHHKAAVRHQPVQAEGHSQNGDPVQDSECDHRTPAPELGRRATVARMWLTSMKPVVPHLIFRCRAGSGPRGPLTASRIRRTARLPIVCEETKRKTPWIDSAAQTEGPGAECVVSSPNLKELSLAFVGGRASCRVAQAMA